MRLFVKQSDVPLGKLWRDFLRVDHIAGKHLFRRLAGDLLAYLRPGFHPNQVGSLEAPLALLRAEGLDA
jgi:predicted metal-dependent hydrolase